MAGYPETLIFYEAPHRLRETLAVLAEALGAERRACAARELTKKFEEFRRMTLGELLAHYRESEPRNYAIHESVFKSINTAVGDLSRREKGYRRMGPPAFVSVCTARRV